MKKNQEPEPLEISQEPEPLKNLAVPQPYPTIFNLKEGIIIREGGNKSWLGKSQVSW